MANRTDYETFINIGGKVNSSLARSSRKACAILGQIRTAAFAAIGVTSFNAAFNAIKNGFSATIEAAKAEIEAQTKLEAILQNVKSLQASGPNAYKAAAQELVNLAGNLQKVGVIGDEITVSGFQQLATFQLSNKEISILSTGMTDLLAQQKGLNATQQDAVNIANMIGKAMMGNVGSLSRVGITFTEAEKAMIKTGNSMQKAAAIAQVLKNNVGGVNKAMAQTDQGRIQQVANLWSDMSERIGMQLLPYLAKLADLGIKYLPMVESSLVSLINLTASFSRGIYNFGNFILQNGDAIIALVSGVATTAIIMNYNSLAWAALGLGLKMGTFTTAVWASVKAIAAQTMALMANPWTWVAIGVGAVVAGVVLLIKNFDLVKAKAIEVWQKLTPLFEVIKKIMMATPIGFAFNAAKTIGDKIKPAKNELGTNYFKGSGGITKVGERGPELVGMGKGAKILSNRKSQEFLNTGAPGVNVNITINGNADAATISNAARQAFLDFERQYNALISRRSRLGYV